MKSSVLVKYKVKFILLVIVILAGFLRLYQIDKVPVSLSWDEAAVGFNAYTIASFGRDEYGKLLPPFFRSFGDDKHPVHIYATAAFVKLLGLSEFSTRLPSAVFGLLNVLLIFFLAKYMFSSEGLGLIAAFFLAISPYNIHFSRSNHEANFTLFFFMLGLTLFYRAIKKNGQLLPLSIFSFGLAFLAYHPSKVIVPVILLLLAVLYRKQIFKSKFDSLKMISVVAIFALLVFLNPQLLGLARVSQTSLNDNDIKNTEAFRRTGNMMLGRLNLTLIQYSWHFSSQYLFISGDKNPRLSSQTGQFYKVDVIFLLLGLVYLLYKRSKAGIVLLMWVLVAPLSSALVKESPHAARAMYMMGSWNLVAALGLCTLFNLTKKRLFKVAILLLAVILLLNSLISYLAHYYGEYAKDKAIDWQYGMKQIAEYTGSHTEYSQVFMTDARSQPYIFFLYYLKPPLAEYLNSVIYNNSENNKSYNTVSAFDRYYFGGWDPIESFPNQGVLYILTPSQYDGLRFRLAFEVKKIIYYPNGTTAYYLVSAK